MCRGLRENAEEDDRERREDNMIRIAVCDDNQKFLEQFKILLQEYLQNNEIEGYIETYRSGKSLLKSKKEYEIYILDIEMGACNGIEVGKKIREKDKGAVILFLTVSREHALEGYEVEALRYLIKEIDPEKQKKDLERVMKLAIEKVKKEAKNLLVLKKEKKLKIPLAEITYVEIYDHTCMIHTIDREIYEQNCSLNEMEERLRDERFFRCHKSYIVNVSHIQLIEDQQITMENGEKILLARRKMKEIKQAMLRYWG